MIRIAALPMPVSEVKPIRFVLQGLALMGLAWAIAAFSLRPAIAITSLAAATITVLRWPWLVWPILAVVLPVTSGFKFGLLSVTEGLLLAAVLLWLIEGTRRNQLRVYQSAVIAPVLIYMAIATISIFRAPSLVNGIAEVVKWAEFAAVIALLPSMVNPSRAIWMVAALIGAGMAQAGLGLIQFTYQIGPEWFVIFDRFMRASGSFRQPNPYAGFLGILLPVAFSMAIWAWTQTFRETGHRLRRFAWAVYFTGGFIICGGGMFASYSRGGWLAAAGAALVVIAVRSKKGLAAAGAGIILASLSVLVGLVSPALVPASVNVRFRGVQEVLRMGEALNQPVTDDNFALLERFAHWTAGYRMWENAPWLGIGAGNYETVYATFRLPLWEEPLGHAHNLYINTLAETGLAGLFMLTLTFAAIAVWIWRRGRVTAGLPSVGWCGAMAAGAMGSLAHLAVHSMVDVLFVQGIYVTLGLILATLAAGCGRVAVTDLGVMEEGPL